MEYHPCAFLSLALYDILFFDHIIYRKQSLWKDIPCALADVSVNDTGFPDLKYRAIVLQLGDGNGTLTDAGLQDFVALPLADGVQFETK